MLHQFKLAGSTIDDSSQLSNEDLYFMFEDCMVSFTSTIEESWTCIEEGDYEMAALMIKSGTSLQRAFDKLVRMELKHRLK